MSLIKWTDPFKTLDSFFDDDFFPVSWHRRNKNDSTSFLPKTNVIEKDKTFILELEVPGVKKEDVNVSVKNGVLTVSGERTNQEERKEDNYYSFESTYGKFERSFQVNNIKEEEIEANYKDGLLILTLPKKEHVIENKKIKKIDVK